MAIAPPEVLSKVPPLIVNVPAVVPNALALLILRTPAFSVTPPVKVFEPSNVQVPEPFLMTELTPGPITLLTTPPLDPCSVKEPEPPIGTAFVIAIVPAEEAIAALLANVIKPE